MSNSLSLPSSWIYNSLMDTEAYYNIPTGYDYIQPTCSEVGIEQDNKGVNYLHIKNKNSGQEEKVHIFISKNFFTNIKYWFLKHCSNDWTEVKLYQADESDKTVSQKEIKVLIDNRNLMANREFNKTIESIFEFALRPKISVLDQVPAKRPELIRTDSSIPSTKKVAEKELINSKWLSFPLIKELLIKQTELYFKNKSLEDAYQSKINDFVNWYQENQSISLTNEDPFADAFRKELINKLLTAMSKVNNLPKEFKEIGLKIKKELISKTFERFLEAFRETTRDREPLGKKAEWDKCRDDILLDIVLNFSGYEKDELELTIDEFTKEGVIFD